VQREWDKRIAAQGVARVAVEDGDELHHDRWQRRCNHKQCLSAPVPHAPQQHQF
jgi:hypothetical protein